MSNLPAETSPPLTEKFKKWLATQGYPLETRIAGTAQRSGLQPLQGYHYLDSKQDVYREVDVYAFVTTADGVRIGAAIEAKSGQTDSKPWAILSARGSRRYGLLHPVASASQRYVASRNGDWWHKRVAKKSSLRELEILKTTDVPGYSLIRASLNTRDSHDDQAFAALMQAVQGAHGIYQEYVEDFDLTEHRGRGDLRFVMILPVIVVDSPLFEVWLDDNADIQVSEVDVGTVIWRNRAHGQQEPHSIVKVIREEALPVYFQSMIAAADEISADLKRSRPRRGS